MSQPKLYPAVSPIDFSHTNNLPCTTVVIPRYCRNDDITPHTKGLSKDEHIALLTQNRNLALSIALQTAIGGMDCVDVADFNQGQIGTFTSPGGYSCTVIASHALFTVGMHTDEQHIHLGLIPEPMVLEFLKSLDTHIDEGSINPERLTFWQELLTTDWDNESDLHTHLSATFERIEFLRDYPEHIALQEEGFTCSQYDADIDTISMIQHCVESFGCLPKDLHQECTKAISEASRLLQISVCSLDGIAYFFKNNTLHPTILYPLQEQAISPTKSKPTQYLEDCHKSMASTKDFHLSI